MQSFLARIIGRPPAFSLEARIFNAICLTSAVCLLLTVFLNVILGIPQLVILMGVVFAISIICYYLARFKMMLNSCIVVYLIVFNILIIFNYKYNSGINGPSLLVFILDFFLTISIVPKKQYWFWITLSIAVVISLLLFEYYKPSTVFYTYHDKESRFIDFGSTFVFIVFFIFLITTSIRNSYAAERELVEQKARELENANETKNKLFSILAHDLRSPLASIQNYLEIISEIKLDEDERLSINKKLLNSTQNTQQMLSNLLFWSKSQMEGVTVNLVKVNLKEILQSTLNIHSSIAAEKDIQLVDNLTNYQKIMADADMLQLIVRNLINNAIKFTNSGGTIVVSADTVDNYCRLIISDNGTGIPYDQQKDIFTLKTKTSYGTKSEKGFGLGLVLCKEFAELQNGKISFESTPGTGTSFYISFRLYREIKEFNISGLSRKDKKSEQAVK